MYLKLVKMGNCLCVFDHNFLKERKKRQRKMLPAFYSAPQGGRTGKWAAEGRPAARPPPGTEESPRSRRAGKRVRPRLSLRRAEPSEIPQPERPQDTNGGGLPQESCTEPPGERALGTRGRDNGQQTGSVMRLCEDRAEARTPCGIRNLCGLDCG